MAKPSSELAVSELCCVRCWRSSTKVPSAFSSARGVPGPAYAMLMLPEFSGAPILTTAYSLESRETVEQKSQDLRSEFVFRQATPQSLTA